MDLVSIVSVLLISLVGSLTLYWLTLRLRLGKEAALRPLEGYAALRIQSGKAVEQGRGVHFSLGRGALSGQSAATSTAALSALDYLTEDGCASDAPPLITAGDGTLFVAGQDSLRGAYEDASRIEDYQPNLVQFLSAEQFSMTYAAGASDAVNRGDLGSNLMLGRFGAEIAIVTESADRLDMEQVIGSDDPTALAVATAVTDKVLIGEEVLAAGAYLERKPAQIASVQLQDIFRVIAIVSILLAALFNIVVTQ